MSSPRNCWGCRVTTEDPVPSLGHIADTAAELAELRQAAEGIIGQAWSIQRTREMLDHPGPVFDQDLWKTIVELGWPDVMVEESRGGGGGGLREVCVLAEAAGGVGAPIPLAATAAAAWCEGACTQQVTVPTAGSAAVTADGATGTWPFVPFGDVAAGLLVLGQSDDGTATLGVVDLSSPGVERESIVPLNHNAAARIAVESAPLDVIATGTEAVRRHRQAMSRAVLATVAELVGVASAANCAAVEYAKVRVAFDKPIGAYQAIKHRLVDHRSTIEVGRALVNRAADAVELGHQDSEALVSLAAFWAIDSLRAVPEGAMQVFGGIGYTWEHVAHVYLRHAATLAATLGSRPHHRSIITDWLTRSRSAQR